MNENQTLMSKLENLENVFIGQPSRRANAHNVNTLTHEYAESTMLLENNDLRRKVVQLEQEHYEMKTMLQ